MNLLMIILRIVLFCKNVIVFHARTGAMQCKMDLKVLDKNKRLQVFGGFFRIFLTLFVLLSFTEICNAQVRGSIFDPASPPGNPLDPNGDGFVTTTGKAFAGPSDESEFEVPFIPIQQFELEPGNDNQYGPGCEFYDLVNDPASGADGGYYYYKNPDGIADNGDELLLFRFRVARFSSGSTGFSILMDTDFKFGFTGPEADPNAVQGNPGFEREIAAFNSTGSNGGVRVFDVDGRDTASIISYAASIHANYQLAYALNQDPECSEHVPVFVDLFVPFSTLGITSSTQIRMAVAVNEEPKTSLDGAASDVGGVNGYLIPDDDDQFIAAITNYSPIAIGDPANKAPLAADATVFLDENTGNGAGVHTVSASDPNGDILFYSITGGNTGSAFAINSASGAITVNKTNILDAETTPSFALTVRVYDGKLYDNAIITINLADVNEPPSATGAMVVINENTADGALVHTVVGTDPDAGTELVYSIVDGNSEGAFALDNVSGEITVKNSAKLDFETSTSFTLTIRVTDGVFADEATVQISVTDVNEAPVIEAATVSLDENTATGYPVYTVQGTDPDGDALSDYLITAGNTAEAFAIDNLSGKINVNNFVALDFETNPVFSLTVRVTDGSLYTDAIITVNIKDLNEPPVVESGSTTVEKRVLDNDVVYTIITTDPDMNDVLSFAIDDGNADELFAVDTRTGDIRVQDATAFNRTPATYDLAVSATDAYGLTGRGIIRIIMARLPERDDIVPQKGFSPNGDGINDFWLINGIERFPDNVIQVFNRGGILVYETQGYNNESNSWSGAGKGTGDQAESTYFFIIKAGNFSPLTGYVIVKP